MFEYCTSQNKSELMRTLVKISQVDMIAQMNARTTRVNMIRAQVNTSEHERDMLYFINMKHFNL